MKKKIISFNMKINMEIRHCIMNQHIVQYPLLILAPLLKFILTLRAVWRLNIIIDE